MYKNLILWLKVTNLLLFFRHFQRRKQFSRSLLGCPDAIKFARFADFKTFHTRSKKKGFQ